VVGVTDGDTLAEAGREKLAQISAEAVETRKELAKRGLWAHKDPAPPWEFRASKRKKAP